MRNLFVFDMDGCVFGHLRLGTCFELKDLKMIPHIEVEKTELNTVTTRTVYLYLTYRPNRVTFFFLFFSSFSSSRFYNK